MGWLVAAIIGAFLVVAGPFLGVAFTVFGLRRSFSSSSKADPSEKARVLAEGISESMNGTAFGIVAALAGMVVVTVALIGYIRAQRSPPEDAG